MKEMTCNEAFQIACNKRDELKIKHDKMAAFWWKYVGNPIVNRAAKKARIKVEFFVPSSFLSEFLDILRKKKFRTYTYRTKISWLTEVGVYWN